MSRQSKDLKLENDYSGKTAGAVALSHGFSRYARWASSLSVSALIALNLLGCGDGKNRRHSTGVNRNLPAGAKAAAPGQAGQRSGAAATGGAGGGPFAPSTDLAAQNKKSEDIRKQLDTELKMGSQIALASLDLGTYRLVGVTTHFKSMTVNDGFAEGIHTSIPQDVAGAGGRSDLTLTDANPKAPQNTTGMLVKYPDNGLDIEIPVSFTKRDANWRPVRNNASRVVLHTVLSQSGTSLKMEDRVLPVSDSRTVPALMDLLAGTPQDPANALKVEILKGSDGFIRFHVIEDHIQSANAAVAAINNGQKDQPQTARDIILTYQVSPLGPNDATNSGNIAVPADASAASVQQAPANRGSVIDGAAPPVSTSPAPAAPTTEPESQADSSAAPTAAAPATTDPAQQDEVGPQQQ